jgi:AraC-like DNA-binding protein
MPSWYRQRQASADLRPSLTCTWRVVGDGRSHRLVPDGCVDVLWTSVDGGVRVCGPETSSWSFALPTGASAVGIRFRPGAAPPALRVDASAMRERQVGWSALRGDRAERVLRERLHDAGDDAARVALLEDAARGAGPADEVTALVAARAAAGSLSIATVAEEAGLSERQLHRRCVRSFGYGASTLARVLRVQRFLAAARAAGRSTSLAELALAAGYADQPHLSRDVRAIAGITPSEVVRSVQDDQLAIG